MKKCNKELNLTESSDFQYLLELMLPLYQESRYAWLPELFSIVGYEKLILLCKYAGGETIKIPTLEQLTDSIEALQWYYDTFITHDKQVTEIPPKLSKIVSKIAKVYDARNS